MPDTITLDAPKTSTAVTEFVPAYRFIEFVSVASHVGKSTLADFTKQLLAQFGIPIRFIRIESKAARSRQSGDVVHIDTENFAAAARLAGAEAAVLRPVFEIMEQAALDEARQVIVLDWGGGLSQLRAQIYAATQFDAQLSDLGMQGLSVVTTTALTDRMAQARELIELTQDIAPGLHIALALNRRNGAFGFVDGTEEKRVFRDLMKAAKDLPVIKVPAVAGESWQACQAAGLTMHEVINMEPAALRRRFGSENRCLVRAFQAHVAAFWMKAESEMLQVLAGTDADPTS
ncbi:hypothetical protein JQ604_03400 [Bradyrhizobium jicamae]|uniref:hypothetical protein n=1 Tax=Bradyrhizobium jicamae TaxID=280332 RepID=UPI001BA86BA1|nr:hypothetical protein [Bradyrhizobium jicamae]MBR0751217.1 hypothetical protein [Bradyrhizobium jicamae]